MPSIKKLVTLVIAILLMLSVLPGCCDSDDCSCPNDSNLPIDLLIGMDGRDSFYWLRLDSNWIVIDSALLLIPPPNLYNIVEKPNWRSLNQLFPDVINFETFNYLLVNRTLQTSDTFSNLTVQYNTNIYDCCRGKISCEQVKYLEFYFNGHQIDTSHFPLLISPD